MGDYTVTEECKQALANLAKEALESGNKAYVLQVRAPRLLATISLTIYRVAPRVVFGEDSTASCTNVRLSYRKANRHIARVCAAAHPRGLPTASEALA
jgi:hypothetical protein